LWAVRFAVLVYALCILAPTLSFALPVLMPYRHA